MALAPGKSGAHLPVAGSLMWRVYLSTRATCRLPSFAPCLGARACLGPPTSPVFGPLTRPRGTVSTPRGYAWAGRDGTQAPNCPGNRVRGGTWLRFPLAAVWPALDVCGGDAPGVQAQYNLRLDLFDLSPALLQRQVLGRQRMLAPAPFPAAWRLHSRADLVAAQPHATRHLQATMPRRIGSIPSSWSGRRSRISTLRALRRPLPTPRPHGRSPAPYCAGPARTHSSKRPDSKFWHTESKDPPFVFSGRTHRPVIRDALLWTILPAVSVPAEYELNPAMDAPVYAVRTLSVTRAAVEPALYGLHDLLLRL